MTDSPGEPSSRRLPAGPPTEQETVDEDGLDPSRAAPSSPATTLTSNGQAPASDAAPHTATGRTTSRAPHRRAHDLQELTTGSIPRNVWRQGWPQVTEQVLTVADTLSDLFWAGRLPAGFRAVAGIGVAQTFTQFTLTARQGLDQSLRAMVSRAVGAGDIKLANHIALQAFTVNVVYALLFLVPGVLLTDTLLSMVGVVGELHTVAAAYMRVQLVATMFVGFRGMTGAALQASGDVITPLRATTFTRLTAMVLAPVLMFGWGVFPEMGLAGAGMANLLGHLGGFCVNSYALFKGNTPLRLTFRGYRMDFPLVWRIIKIGVPASLAGVERSSAQIVLLWLVTPFGDIATAAYALTRRMEHLTQLGSQGMGQAAGVMVGQNLGARRPDRARWSVGWALVYVAILQAATGALLFVFAAPVVKVFADEAEVVQLASVWLRIQVIASILMALGTVFQYSYNTAGDTWAPLLVIFFGLWVVEIPLAWVLVHNTGLGAIGIALATIGDMAARLVCFIPYFFWDRWLRVRVID